MDYFGACYYHSKIGRWLSVDPLADKYPGWSPYNYTLNNPLRLVDPDGRNPKDNNRVRSAYNSYIGGMKSQFTHAVNKTLNYYTPVAADYLSTPLSWSGIAFPPAGAVGLGLKGFAAISKSNNPYFDKPLDVEGDVANMLLTTDPILGTAVEMVIDTYGENLENNNEKNNEQSISNEKEQSTIEALERMRKLEEERRKQEEEESKNR